VTALDEWPGQPPESAGEPPSGPPPHLPPEAGQQMPAEPPESEPLPEQPTHAPPLPPEATQQLPPEEREATSSAPGASPGAPPQALGWEPPPRRYPVTLDLTGPARVSRLSTLFRLILMIPLMIFVAILGGSFFSFGFLVGAGGGLITFVLFVHWITVFFRGRPVSWAWGTIVGMQRFILRSYSYFFLLTDRYPPYDGDWYLQFEVEKPERVRRRQLFFWKTFASIPHFIILSALWFGVAVCEVFGWFAILFTGRFPRGMRNFVVGWMRWYARVGAYWMSLRDEFPPYSLSAAAGPGSRTSLLVSAFLGFAFVVGLVALIIGVVASATGSVSTNVDYTRLTQGTRSATIDVSNVDVTLTGADDDYDFPGGLYAPARGYRFVEFEVHVRNGKITALNVDEGDFHLSVDRPRVRARNAVSFESGEPVFLSVGGTPPPASFNKGASGDIMVVFEIPEDATPSKLTYQPSPGLKKASFAFH
jgi:hypothetical protein